MSKNDSIASLKRLNERDFKLLGFSYLNVDIRIEFFSGRYPKFGPSKEGPYLKNAPRQWV